VAAAAAAGQSCGGPSSESPKMLFVVHMT
jgi:hypothetical protein